MRAYEVDNAWQAEVPNETHWVFCYIAKLRFTSFQWIFMEFHGSVQSRKARRGFCIVYLYDCFFFTYPASHQYQKIPRSLLHAHLNGLFPTVDTCYNVAKSFHWYSCCQDLQNTMRVIASKDSNDDLITFLSSVPSSPGLVKTTCRQCRQSQEVVIHKSRYTQQRPRSLVMKTSKN